MLRLQTGTFRGSLTGVQPHVRSSVAFLGPPKASSLSDEEYKAACEEKIASGSYPQNYDCSQRLHTEAGLADAILELSDSTKVARDGKETPYNTGIMTTYPWSLLFRAPSPS